MESDQALELCYTREPALLISGVSVLDLVPYSIKSQLRFLLVSVYPYNWQNVVKKETILRSWIL
jgi:hypothetical protein